MRTRLFGLLGSTIIVLAACGQAASPTPAPGGTPTAAPPPTAAPTPVPIDELEELLFKTDYEPVDGTDGGTLIVGDWQEANQFNPFYLGQVTEANVASAVWATLVVLTHDARYAADLAAEVPTTANGGVQAPGVGGDAMTVTWKLREGLKWSDGQALDCADFRYAWQWVLDPNNVGVITTGYDEITDWECASPTEMVLHFKSLYSGYLTLTTAPLPEHYLKNIPVADQVQGAGFRPDEIANMPVSGAFKFESVTPDAELRLVRNANYTSWKTGKPAQLDRIIFKWYGTPDALIAGFKGNEIDLATGLSNAQLPSVRDLGDRVSAIPAFVYEFLRPNWADGTNVKEDGTGDCSRNPVVQDRGTGCPISDPAMREAISFAIDKNAINDRILSGSAQVANTNISPVAWFYSDQPPATYDPAKARQILDAAGWTVGADGVRSKGGLRAKIELCSTAAQFRIDTLALIASWLKDVGIEAIPNNVSASDIFADYNEATRDTPCALSRSNFDLAEHAFSSSIDPLGGYFSYHSSQFEPTGANDAQINDPDLDAAFDVVRNSVDFGEIRDAMAVVQKVFIEKTVEIPLYYRQNVELVSPRAGNFFANPTQAGPTWNVVDWYVK
jgi:peptide/nickel transport system substrate-binding protein